MNKQTLIPMVLAGFALTAIHSSAQAAGYIGAAFGRSDVDVSGYDEAESWQLFGGARFSPYFAVEAAYTDLGQFDLKGASNTYVEIDGVEITAVGMLPVSNYVTFFGEAGLFAWNLDATLFGSDFGSDDGTDLTYGAGVKLRLVESLDLQFEYQHYEDISDADVDTLYAGLVYGF